MPPDHGAACMEWLQVEGENRFAERLRSRNARTAGECRPCCVYGVPGDHSWLESVTQWRRACSHTPPNAACSARTHAHAALSSFVASLPAGHTSDCCTGVVLQQPQALLQHRCSLLGHASSCPITAAAAPECAPSRHVLRAGCRSRSRGRFCRICCCCRLAAARGRQARSAAAAAPDHPIQRRSLATQQAAGHRCHATPDTNDWV